MPGISRPYSLALVLIATLLLAACDPGWAIAVRNEDSKPWLIRVSYLDLIRVFHVEAGTTTGILGSVGSFPQPMEAELLDESCAVMTSTNVPVSASHSMIVIRPNRTLALADIPPTDEVAPGIPEVRGGKCGGLP